MNDGQDTRAVAASLMAQPPEKRDPSTRSVPDPNPSGICLIIPTRDSAPTLRALAESIRAQQSPPDEVIVVDSSRDDRTVREAEVYGLQVIRSDVSRIAARRIGALRSTSPWICLIDADQLLDPAFVHEMAQATRLSGADALTPLELSYASGPWGELLRAQDRAEFFSGEGLPRCWRRSVFLEFQWGGLENLPHVNGEDRLLRNWLLGTHRRIHTVPTAVVYHQDPELGPFLRKQFKNMRTGSAKGVPTALAPSAMRSLVTLLSSRAVLRSTGGPSVWFGYYWMLMARVTAQTAGLAASRMDRARRVLGA